VNKRHPPDLGRLIALSYMLYSNRSCAASGLLCLCFSWGVPFTGLCVAVGSRSRLGHHCGVHRRFVAPLPRFFSLSLWKPRSRVSSMYHAITDGYLVIECGGLHTPEASSAATMTEALQYKTAAHYPGSSLVNTSVKCVQYRATR
jgi:hypothetical protein